MHRCPRCWLHLSRCLCAHIPCVVTRTRFVLVRHPLERWKNSNTARLAALAMPRLTLVDHAGNGESAPVMIPASAWLLYPDAPPASPAPPATVVVLDGSWSQTRRMAQRIPWLRDLPRMSLPAATTRLPHLRKQQRDDGMSTLEAIYRATALLEGEERAAPLARLMERAVLHHSVRAL